MFLFLFAGRKRRKVSSAAPVRRSPRVNAAVSQKTESDVGKSVEKKKAENGDTGGSAEILVRVETEPVKNSCVVIGNSEKEDVVDGSSIDQKSDMLNWQDRNQYEVAQVKLGSEVPKTMNNARMNRMAENGVHTSDGRFADSYNYPVASYANVAENNFNARYLSRNWIGHPNEPICQISDTYMSPTIPERELYNMVNNHGSEPVSNQLMAPKFQSYNTNDGITMVSSEKPLHVMRATSTTKAQGMNNMSFMSGDMSQYGANANFESIGNSTVDFGVSTNFANHLVDRRRNSFFDPSFERNRYY